MAEEPGATPRRRDAQQNRERILAAARQVFAQSGFDASLDLVARRAGVGRATLYRNFPDRYALGAAILEQNLQALEAIASQHQGQPDALPTLLQAIASKQIETYALFPALLASSAAPDLQVLTRRMTRLLAGPLRSAQASGWIRGDLTIADLLAVIATVSATVAGVESVRHRQARAARALELILHGIAGPAAAALPRPDDTP